MKKYDFVTIGGATEDITFYTHEGQMIANRKDILRQKLLAFEYGTKIKIDRSNSTFGGGAANAAVCFSRLGFKAAAIVAVGDDERGGKITANLNKEKVDTNLAEKIKGGESGYSFILTGSDNEHIVFSNRGANSQLSINNLPADRQGYQLTIINNTEWIYLTSLSGNWEEVLRKVFNTKNVKIAWNPGHIQLNSGIAVLGKYLKKTEALIVNKDEAIELVVSDKRFFKSPSVFLNEIKNLIKIIYEHGPKIAVITNGKHGAYAYDGKKIYYQPVIKEKKRINTTGVGDAFGSSFVAGLELYKGDIQKAMNLAARNSASVVSCLGAQAGLLKKKDIK
jgi:sugar/nucleoside kinase (ribokinase family)